MQELTKADHDRKTAIEDGGLAILLPKPRAVSVPSIQYINLAGELATLDPATYFVDVNSEPARIVPQPGLYWPYTQGWLPNSVIVSYTAGSYDAQVTDSLVVLGAGDPEVYTVTLSQAAAFAARSFIQTSPVTLSDAEGNLVAFSMVSPGVVSVASTYNGQTLSAVYYAGKAPQTVCQAMLLLISYWYNHRDAAETNPPKSIDLAVDSLLAGETFETFGF